MRFLVVVTAAVAALALSGCASDTKQAAHSLGLTSGPLPSPQPFVVESRAAQTPVYPAVGVTPPPRSDRVLNQDQRKALEASLLATPGRQPSPSETAQSGKKKRKPVLTRQGQSFHLPK
ncbi:hypothetical protein LMIY3S_02140 [Labrys miyagiensis]